METIRVSQVKWNFLPELQRLFSMVLLAVCDADYLFTLFNFKNYDSSNECANKFFVKKRVGTKQNSISTRWAFRWLQIFTIALLPVRWTYFSSEKMVDWAISWQMFDKRAKNLWLQTISWPFGIRKCI